MSLRMAEVFNLRDRRKAASNARIDAMVKGHADCQREATEKSERLRQERVVLGELNYVLRKVYAVFGDNRRADDYIALAQTVVKP